MPVPNQDPAGVRRGPLWEQLGLRGAPRLCRAGGRLEAGGRRARPSDGLIGGRGALSGGPGAQRAGGGEAPAWGWQITAAPRPAPAPPLAPGPAPQAAAGAAPAESPPGAVSPADQPLTQLRRREPRESPPAASPPLPARGGFGVRGSCRGGAAQRRLQEEAKPPPPGGGSRPCLGRGLWGSRWPSALPSPGVHMLSR